MAIKQPQPFIAICFLMLHTAFAVAHMHEDLDLSLIGQQVVDHLNKWCPDAWCAGDFHHTFFNFSYAEKSAGWWLTFQTFPHEKLEIDMENMAGNFTSVPMTLLHSWCFFPSLNPLDMVEAKPKNATGISQQMRELLMICTAKAEKDAELLFGGY